MATSFPTKAAKSHSKSECQEKFHGAKTSHIYSKSNADHLLELPPETLTRILSYLSFKTISELRSVCRQFNDVCATILNNAFQTLCRKARETTLTMQKQLPPRRWRSARSKHPLLATGLLQQSQRLSSRLSRFNKLINYHLERGDICFFPGEFLDVSYSILWKLRPGIYSPHMTSISDTLWKEWNVLREMSLYYYIDDLQPELPPNKAPATLDSLEQELDEWKEKVQKLEKVVSKVQKVFQQAGILTEEEDELQEV